MPDTDLFGRPVAAHVAREWVPTAYLDELSPEGRANPDAWLETLPDGRKALAQSPLSEDDTRPPVALSDGDCVEFRWYSAYPDVDLEIRQDGTWTASAQPHPETQTVSVWGDPDTSAENLDDLIKQLRDKMSQSGTSEAYTIECYRWSESLPLFFSERTGRLETGLAETPAAGAA